MVGRLSLFTLLFLLCTVVLAQPGGGVRVTSSLSETTVSLDRTVTLTVAVTGAADGVDVPLPEGPVTAATVAALAEGFAEAHRQRYGFVMEESGVVEGSDRSHRWHVDPLDGTTNFLHAIPVFAVSRFTSRQIDWPTT